MTTQEKIDFIRSKCIEANPSILHLVIGCRFSITKGTRVIRYVFDSGWEENDGFLIYTRNPGLYDATWKLNILGRDIRLADVLVALGKLPYLQFDLLLTGKLHIGAYGDGTTSNGYYTKCYWNLLKDRLEDQSEETIEFVYNLLANNK